MKINILFLIGLPALLLCVLLAWATTKSPESDSSKFPNAASAKIDLQQEKREIEQTFQRLLPTMRERLGGDIDLYSENTINTIDSLVRGLQSTALYKLKDSKEVNDLVDRMRAYKRLKNEKK